jgi:mRNA interferase YafQ
LNKPASSDVTTSAKPKARIGRRCKPIFAAIITALANDRLLAEKHRDHALTGDWKDHRDCHIKPDLVLIYRKPDATVLQLVRLGSHSELGL